MILIVDVTSVSMSSWDEQGCENNEANVYKWIEKVEMRLEDLVFQAFGADW